MQTWQRKMFLLIFVCFCWVVSGETHAEWLQISGEKGFSFDSTGSSDGWEDSLQFNQSLLLDLSGEFGDEYFLEGHLVDEANAPTQLFLSLRGRNNGLQFGGGDLSSFSTALTSWNGDFNGLDAYFNTSRNQLKLAYANPTGTAASETLVFKTGKNYTYLTYLPVVDDTLEVYKNGVRLEEAVDYRFDPFTGKLELLFYPQTELRLEVKYQYSVSEILGGRFYALRDSFTFGKHSTGFEFFGSTSQSGSEPVLLGEVNQTEQFSLNGFFYGYQGLKWRWDVELWSSQEEIGSSWNYLDNMEGSDIKTECFSDSTNPWNWFSIGTGSARLDLGEVSPNNDPQHTRDSDPSLLLDYHLERTGDSAFILHDFGSYRDYTLLSELNLWFYLNGEDVQLETQIITSENNYYFKRCRVNLSGWFNMILLLNPTELDRVGIPDLSRIRYIKVIISGPNGDSGSGRIFLAPPSVISRSLAEQRWAKTETSAGSMIEVNTVNEAVTGEASGNQVLQLDFNLVGSGWAKATYEPPAVINISDYRRLKLYLNSPEVVSLTVLATRGNTEYTLGELDVMTYGDWKEYEISLEGLPLRVLERIESLSLKVNAPEGSHSLKIDGIRVDGRDGSDASALKMKGIYQDGPWRNQLEYQTYAPGFREIGQQYNYATRNLRNITQFQGEAWHFKTDVKSYQKAESINGYPLQGNQAVIEMTGANTRLTLTQLDEEAAATAEGLLGKRSESLLNLHHQKDFWGFDYQFQRVDDTSALVETTTNNSLTIRYERDNFWTESQIWQEQIADTALTTGKMGSNFGLGYRKSASDRFQLQGGMVQETGVVDSYFYQSDLAFTLPGHLSLQAFLKSLSGPEDSDGLTKDRQVDVWLRERMAQGIELSYNYKFRDWTEVDSGNSLQVFNSLQSSFRWADNQKVSFFYRMEQLENGSGRGMGSRIGTYGDVNIIRPWQTQFSAEVNLSDGESSLIAQEESDYEFSTKNSIRQGKDLYYWGVWGEGADESSSWERELLQAGWEIKYREGIVYGAKFDAGAEDSKEINGFIWGGGGFLNIDKSAHRFRLNVRYQTFDDYIWKFSFYYDYVKNDSYSFNLQTHFLRDRDTGDDLTFHADLRIILR